MRAVQLLVLLVLLLSACSTGADDASDPVVRPGDGPAGGRETVVGTVRLSLPRAMEQVVATDAPDGVTKGTYRSTVQDDGGRAAAVVVTVADRPQRSAKAEAETIVSYQRDVAKGVNVRSGPVDWPGFGAAYGVAYDGAGGQAGAEPLHHLVVVAETDDGLVNVTVAAPPVLFTSLDLADAVGSLRPATISG